MTRPTRILRALQAVLIGVLLVQATGAAAQSAAGGVSAVEAQSLSARDLASRVLGDVGSALVADVDRPAWGSDPGAWERRAGDWPPSMPPPLHALIFYGRPSAGSFGMCEQLLITVRFGAAEGTDARQMPVEIETERRFGVIGETTPPPGYYSQQYRQALEAQCAQQPVSREYFPADGSGDANYVARITQRLHELGIENESTPGFRFTCQEFREPCSDASAILRGLNWRSVRSIRSIPCPDGRHIVRWPRCFDVVYGISIEAGRRVQTLGYVNLRVVAGFPERDLVIESAEISRDSAVP